MPAVEPMKTILIPRRRRASRSPRRAAWTLAGRSLWLGLAAGCCVIAGCFLGVDFEKVDDNATCAFPTPGTCEGGVAFQLKGSGNVEVTDMAMLGDQGAMVLVGRFSGSFTPPMGPQLDAGGSTEGFLLELDTAGNYLRHLIISEADETSLLRVAVDAATTEVVVAATYSKGPVGLGGCASPTGVFAKRLAANGQTYISQLMVDAACMGVTASTQLSVNDVGVYPGSLYLQVVGSFDGTIVPAVTSEGLDGFAMSVTPDGMLEPTTIVTGSGDATIVAAMPSNPNNEWLLVGHFSGEMVLDIIPNEPETRTAANGNDIFIVSYDTLPGNENLSLTTLPSSGGDHRVVGLAYDATAPASAVLLAQLDGGIFLPGSTNINGEGGAAALAMTFQVPVDSAQTPFAVQDVHLLRGAQMVPRLIAGVANNYLLAGEAVGVVTIEHAGDTIGEIASRGCQKDAFLVLIQGGSVPLPERCGDGQQQPMAIAKSATAGAVAITVPAGAALRTLTSEGAVDGGSDTFILRQ